MTLNERFITIKIPESIHANLTQYRDDNRLKSIGIAVQDGLDCLNLHNEMEYAEHDIIQDSHIDRWSKAYAILWIKYLNTLNQDEVTIHLDKYSTELYIEIEQVIENPAFNNIKNRYALYGGWIKNFESTLDVIKNSVCDQETISKISEMYLHLLIGVYNQLFRPLPEVRQ